MLFAVVETATVEVRAAVHSEKQFVIVRGSAITRGNLVVVNIVVTFVRRVNIEFDRRY